MVMNRATVNIIRRAVISIGATVEVFHIVHKVTKIVKVAEIVKVAIFINAITAVNKASMADRIAPTDTIMAVRTAVPKAHKAVIDKERSVIV